MLEDACLSPLATPDYDFDDIDDDTNDTDNNDKSIHTIALHHCRRPRRAYTRATTDPNIHAGATNVHSVSIHAIQPCAHTLSDLSLACVRVCANN